MKAIVWTKYGPPEVLQLREVANPSPKDSEILVKIKATSVTAGDCEIRRFKIAPMFWLPVRLFMGVFKPRILSPGQEFSGVVEAVGKNVTKFKVGDAIFGPTDMKLSTYAEYITLKEDHCISHKPTNISFEEAASIPVGGLNALHFLQKANIQQGDKVLINGAGGSIGTFGIQLAKLYGAEVTAVDSTAKLSVLSALGADHVIDYTQKDFTKEKEHYDVIFDVVGMGFSFKRINRLKPGGRYLQANPGVRVLIGALFTKIFGSKKIITGMASYKIEEIQYLSSLLEAGKIKPVIDKIFPLEQIVEAHHYVEANKKTGSLVITI